MKRHTSLAALAAFVVAALGAAPSGAMAQPLPDAQAAAAKGHALPTRDGRCAMWLATAPGPQPGEATTWTGGCRNGLGDGFGIQEFVRADGSRLRHVGHVRDGRWHGLGRQHHWDAGGRLLGVVEGVFENGVEQGVFQELVLEHPLNGSLDGVRQTGHGVGATAVQVQQFYTDGAAVLMCAPGADCTRDVAAEGYSLRAPDLGEGMNRTLPYGGWRFEVRTEGPSAGTGGPLQPGPPETVGICLDASQVRPSHEPRAGALLFPSFSAWQAHLRSDHQCEDLAATLVGGTLAWTSQCRPADRSALVTVTQVRSVGDSAMHQRTDTVFTRGGQETARFGKEVAGRFVGACTDDMVRAGQLGF